MARQLELQMVFQDPYASLNPRLRVSDIVGEAPAVHGLIAKHQQAAQELARKQPRVVIKSRNSPASVIATQEALREGNRSTAAFRDAVRKHLKKSAPASA